MARVRLIIRRRPLSGGVQNAENAHRVADYVINYNEVHMHHQFPRTCDPPRTTNVWVRG